MGEDILRVEDATGEAREMQKGILEAYSRGFLSEKQAMIQLGLTSYDEMLALLEFFKIKAWEPDHVHDEAMQYHREIGDGFASYWNTRNWK